MKTVFISPLVPTSFCLPVTPPQVSPLQYFSPPPQHLLHSCSSYEVASNVPPNIRLLGGWNCRPVAGYFCFDPSTETLLGNISVKLRALPLPLSWKSRTMPSCTLRMMLLVSVTRGDFPSRKAPHCTSTVP